MKKFHTLIINIIFPTVNIFGNIYKVIFMKKTKYYIGIIFVILIWGVSPVINKYLLDYYSVASYNLLTSLVAFFGMLALCVNKLGKINKKYFIAAVPTGIFYSCAVIFQKVGLVFTTPAKFSFLENFSILVVPILMYIFVKQKITPLKIISALLCLWGMLILCDVTPATLLSVNKGDILCALSGIFYGVNIAGTAAFSKDLDSSLYLLIQFFIHALVSVIYFLFLGASIEISYSIIPLIILISTVLISSVLGWLIRTKCLVHLDATFVAVAMPFSSVITAVISVITGTDSLSKNLIISIPIITVAIILSSVKLRFKER